MEPQTNAADVAPVTPESQTPVTPSNQPDFKAMYEDAQAKFLAAQTEAQTNMSRFVGMQGKYQTEKSKWESQMAQVKDLPTQLATTQEQFDKAQQEAQQLKEQLDLANSEAQVARLQADRLNIIVKEFPQLLQFEADGLLPDDSGDELRTKLTAFSKRLTDIGGDAFKQMMIGASPASPTSAGQKSATDLWKEVGEALRTGNMAEYDKAYAAYLQASIPGA